MVMVSSTSLLSTSITDRSPENARFTNIKLEHLQGEILGFCKDQHGCRYLQRKLEERNPEHVQLIFLETHQHVVELMTGTTFHPKTVSAPADQRRSVWQLSLPETSRVLE